MWTVLNLRDLQYWHVDQRCCYHIQGGHAEAARLLLWAGQATDSPLPEPNHRTLSSSLLGQVGLLIDWDQFMLFSPQTSRFID